MDIGPPGSSKNNTERDPHGGDAAPPAPLFQWMKATQNTLHNLTVKRYSLPDKTVASQVLMYRQLLHTGCRAGLKLSRDYTGTAAQMAVRHQPWWSQSVEQGQVLTMVETGKMVISYDNLITRLWNTGVCRFPASSIDTTELPPIPHEQWITKLGFQQADPVTDFRSGGVLSLALMVWIVESCPETFARFCEGGDAQVLPFGITSINVTDLLAKLFLLSKRTDRMEALLSQKPFWQMFNDPSAILVCQQVALDMLADVVVELQQVQRKTITVFDFAQVLKITEHRVEYDLLGAGPVSVPDLRHIYKTVRRKYWDKATAKASTNNVPTASSSTTTVSSSNINNNNNSTTKKIPSFNLKGLAEKVGATGLVDKAGQATGTVLSKGNEFLSKVIHSPMAAAASPTMTTTTTNTTTSTIAENRTTNEESTVFDFAMAPPVVPQPPSNPQAGITQQQQQREVDFLLGETPIIHDQEEEEEIDLLGGDDWVGANAPTTVHNDKFQIDDDDFLL